MLLSLIRNNFNSTKDVMLLPAFVCLSGDTKCCALQVWSYRGRTLKVGGLEQTIAAHQQQQHSMETGGLLQTDININHKYTKAYL